MNPYQLTFKAKEDLLSILDYIAAENEGAAGRVESAVLENCDFLAAHPFAGHIRRDLTPRPVRFWAVQRFPNYLIVYNPAFGSTHRHPNSSCGPRCQSAA